MGRVAAKLDTRLKISIGRVFKNLNIKFAKLNVDFVQVFGSECRIRKRRINVAVSDVPLPFRQFHEFEYSFFYGHYAFSLG
jgi:hypothetical protein